MAYNDQHRPRPLWKKKRLLIPVGLLAFGACSNVLSPPTEPAKPSAKRFVAAPTHEALPPATVIPTRAPSIKPVAPKPVAPTKAPPVKQPVVKAPAPVKKALPPAPSPPPSARTFNNCTEMHTVYPHGVGRPGAVDQTSGTPVTTFVRSTALYMANSGSDRDGDGIACEKK